MRFALARPCVSISGVAFRQPSVSSMLFRALATRRSGRKSSPVKRIKQADPEAREKAKAYRQAYYKKNRERLLERNKNNRATKNALAKVGIYTTGKKGRPTKTRADVDRDDQVMSPEELREEIERHEKAHEDWLAQVEADRKELLRMYEDEEEDDEDGGRIPGLEEEDDEEEDEPRGPLRVGDVVRVLRAHGARDVATLDLRNKTDLTEFKVIVTGSSPAHMRAMADAVFRAFKRHKAFHSMPRVEGRTNPDWVLVDAMFVMVHIFNEPTRRKYNLEALWGLRPSAEELALTNDMDWETELFPEFGEEEYELLEDDD